MPQCKRVCHLTRLCINICVVTWSDTNKSTNTSSNNSSNNVMCAPENEIRQFQLLLPDNPVHALKCLVFCCRCNTNVTWLEKHARYVWAVGCTKKLRNLGCDTKDDNIRQPVCGHSVCVCVCWNVSQYKCHYFSTHFFLRQKNLPNSNAHKCIDLAKLPNSGDRLSIFLTNFFPFRKFDTVVCATNECAGECMQNPLAFTKEYTRFYSLSREITTAVLFFLLGVASPLFKI